VVNGIVAAGFSLRVELCHHPDLSVTPPYQGKEFFEKRLMNIQIMGGFPGESPG